MRITQTCFSPVVVNNGSVVTLDDEIKTGVLWQRHEGKYFFTGNSSPSGFRLKGVRDVGEGNDEG